MRSFIAIPAPEVIKKHLSSIQSELKKSGASVKWVKEDNIHLTLKFLGEISDKQIETIAAILDKIASGRKVYTISLEKLGAFPKISSPRTIWMGIEEGKEETTHLAAGLEEELAKSGFPKEERPFSCHLTIGRVKSPSGLHKLSAQLQTMSKEPPREKLCFKAEKIVLFKSSLTPAGAAYEPLAEVSLINT